MDAESKDQFSPAAKNAQASPGGNGMKAQAPQLYKVQKVGIPNSEKGDGCSNEQTC